jgi:hypothetical protein
MCGFPYNPGDLWVQMEAIDPGLSCGRRVGSCVENGGIGFNRVAITAYTSWFVAL